MSNENVLEFVEKVKKAVEEDGINCIAICAVGRDGDVYRGLIVNEDSNQYALLGSLEYMKSFIIEKMNNESS